MSCRIYMVAIGDGALRVLPDSPMYSSKQLMYGHFNLYITALFLYFVVPVLGAMRRVLMVLVPLKCTWDHQAVANPSKPLPQYMDVWYHYRRCFLLFDPLLLLLLLLLGWLPVVVCPLCMLCLQLNLFCRVWRAHCGKLQTCRAFLM